jgi:hypothetical protein
MTGRLRTGRSCFKVTSGPVLDKPGDLAGILTSLEPNDVLFIDEIHRLSPVVEEYLYSAMEDYRIDIMIDKGPSARSIQLDLNPFTLVGATTRSGLLTAPLRARFGINLHLEYYDAEVLSRIVERSAHILSVPIEHDAAMEIAGRSRGTPRIANALLRRVRDFAQVRGCRLFGPLCRQHHLHPDVQLHGMCLGRFRRIRHGHAPVLHRGTEEKPRPISVEIHRHLRTDCRRLLRHHGLYARRMARMDTTGYQHGAHPALRRTYPETRPTGTKPTGHRQIFS